MILDDVFIQIHSFLSKDYINWISNHSTHIKGKRRWCRRKGSGSSSNAHSHKHAQMLFNNPTTEQTCKAGILIYQQVPVLNTVTLLAMAYEVKWSVLSFAISPFHLQCTVSVCIITELARAAERAEISYQISVLAEIWTPSFRSEVQHTNHCTKLPRPTINSLTESHMWNSNPDNIIYFIKIIYTASVTNEPNDFNCHDEQKSDKWAKYNDDHCNNAPRQHQL